MLKTGYRWLVWIALILTTSASLGYGQAKTSPNMQPASANTKLPEFEVASVRPSVMKSGGVIGVFADPGGRVRISHLTVQLLLFVAFDLQPDRIVGGPGWKLTDQYDINAIPSGSSSVRNLSPPSINSPLNEYQRLMLQSLLMDRFHLRYHFAAKSGAVFELRRGNGKLQLHRAANPQQRPFVGGNEGGLISGDGLLGENAHMSLLSATISQYLGRPVVDKTGLSGAFDFKYEYVSDPSNQNGVSNSDDKSASILTSIRQLGLDLKPSVGEVKTLVIDNVEHPSPN